MKKKEFYFWRSKCCKAEAIVNISPDFIGDNPQTMRQGTCFFSCSKCGKPCDAEETIKKADLTRLNKGV